MLRTIALFLALAVLAAPIMSQIIVCDGRTCGGTGIVSCDGQLRDYVRRPDPRGSRYGLYRDA
jgi:hypothetical protein